MDRFPRICSTTFHNNCTRGWKGVSEISHICSIISARVYLIHCCRYLAQSEYDERTKPLGIV